MRYSHPLQKSSKHHILKHHFTSGAISWAWILAAFLVVGFVFSFSSLSWNQILGGFVVSLIRTSISYIIAATLAIIIALAMTSSRWLEGLLLPVFDVLQSFPSFALFPVLVVALRNSPEFIIIIVLTITMIWPILFSIIGGIKNRRQDFEEAATIFGARGSKRLVHFVFPELMPSIVTGSIVGWGEGWEFIIGAELLVKTNIGIGSYLGFLGQNQKNVALAFGIIILLMLLFVINKLIWLPLLTRATNYSSES
ncbi:MAG: ABC transporter permease subunit [Candidatus Berkelbacteria bacterium]|nr:ABC transporter permease subunit [Candidatus Berkelbacteria bacterium]